MKTIVFCADGTWDGPENAPDAYPSNVLKLFNRLVGALRPGSSPTALEQERYDGPASSPTQVAKYIHGVGDTTNKLHKLVCGSLGLGLVARILRGYTFISRNYARGDRIVLVGFSRGAYTARALGDFICKVGLLDWAALKLESSSSDLRGYQYAAAAWLQYQRQRSAALPHRFWLGSVEAFEAEFNLVLPSLLLKPQYIDQVPVSAIGVWDTVGALGIPELTSDHGARLDLLRFVNTDLDAGVTRAFHAVAADEQRIDFSPTLWTPDPRVTQCYFPGAHADVGGGYPLGGESELSDCALAWMAEQLKEAAVGFLPIAPVPAGYQSGPAHMPWTSTGFQCRPTGPREFPEYREKEPRITPHAGLCNRIGQIVTEYAATTPPVSRRVPYLPVALVRARYIDLAAVKAKA